MIGTTRDVSSKSKLIERLRQISRGAPAPIGFGRTSGSTAPAMMLAAILPRNDLALAEAAVDSGADVIIFRILGASTEFLAETGGRSDEEAVIKEAIAVIGDRAIPGLIVGSNGSLAASDVPTLPSLGVDFVASYPHLTPATFLELSDVGRVAILDQQGGQISRGINDLSIQGALLRIERPTDSPPEMTVLDVATYRGAADGIHRPIIVLPSWTLHPNDLEVLRNAGIEAVALVGPTPDADAVKIAEVIAPYREIVKRLGKPSGRRVALAEPTVILPRMASLGGGGVEPDEEPDEDDDE